MKPWGGFSAPRNSNCPNCSLPELWVNSSEHGFWGFHRFVLVRHLTCLRLCLPGKQADPSLWGRGGGVSASPMLFTVNESIAGLSSIYPSMISANTTVSTHEPKQSVPPGLPPTPHPWVYAPGTPIESFFQPVQQLTWGHPTTADFH